LTAQQFKRTTPLSSTYSGMPSLKKTKQHKKPAGTNFKKLRDCEQELKAFARGGLPGLEVLGRVYLQIFKHFGVTDGPEKYRLLRAAGLYLDESKNRITWISASAQDVPPSFACGMNL